MVVDEEGLLTERPTLNYIGSYLYGTQVHEQPIVGNVLILPEVEGDFQFMPMEQAERVAGMMEDLAMTAYHSVGKALGSRIQKKR